MCDRMEMLEATLDFIDEGIAILDDQSNVLFWNKAATDLTGHRAQDLLLRRCPEGLYRIDEEHRSRVAEVRRRGAAADTDNHPAKVTWTPALPTALLALEDEPKRDCSDLLQLPTLVSLGHKLGHTVPGMLRKIGLRDSQGEPAGAVLLFYPVEEMDALPHGESGGGAEIERSQANMEDRLEAAQHQWIANRMPFGLLWITVDQARSMRTTHGRDACEAMLHTVEQTLLRQLKPAEIIGRWGNNEFLVLAHERTAELLHEHAQRLAGLARTADFRWWGDRLGLTVSIGASQVVEGDTLQCILSRVRQAMQASSYAGGNHVTEAKGT